MEKAGRVRAIYRDIGTVDELEHYASIWLGHERYRDHRFGWFAFHGSAGQIHIGRQKLSLDRLAADVFGKRSCQGKTLYFDSCGTVNVAQEELRAFRVEIGARIVCGFTKNVKWLEAAAFDLLLLNALESHRSRPTDALGVIRRDHAGLADHLGFQSDPPWTDARR